MSDLPSNPKDIGNALITIAENVQRINKLKEQDPNYPVANTIQEYLKTFDDPESLKKGGPSFKFIVSYVNTFLEDPKTKDFSAPEIQNYFINKASEWNAIENSPKSAEKYYKVFLGSSETGKKRLKEEEAGVAEIKPSPEFQASFLKKYIGSANYSVPLDLPPTPQEQKDSQEVAKGFELRPEVNKANAGELKSKLLEVQKKFQDPMAVSAYGNTANHIGTVIGQLRNIEEGKETTPSSVRALEAAINKVSDDLTDLKADKKYANIPGIKELGEVVTRANEQMLKQNENTGEKATGEKAVSWSKTTSGRTH